MKVHSLRFLFFSFAVFTFLSVSKVVAAKFPEFLILYQAISFGLLVTYASYIYENSGK